VAGFGEDVAASVVSCRDDVGTELGSGAFVVVFGVLAAGVQLGEEVHLVSWMSAPR
jgi:hypothetical protein